MTSNSRRPMRNTPSRLLALACGFLFSIALAHAVERRLSDAIPLEREVKLTLGALAPDRYAVVFKQQEVSLKTGSIAYLAGAVAGGKAPVFADCFLFVKAMPEPGRVFFTTAKAAKIWSCVGDPKVDAIAVHGSEVSALVLSMFQYQAPSGDFFNLPMVVQSDKSGAFTLGDVDKCVEKKLQRIELKSISQLRRYAGECVKVLIQKKARSGSTP